MIADRTIDEKSAMYWCAFADKDFIRALDKIVQTISDKKQQDIAKKTIQSAKGGDVLIKEGFTDFLAKFTPTDPTGGSVGIVGDLAGKSPEEIKANAVGMATAAGVAGLALTPAGRALAGTAASAAAANPGKTALLLTAGKLGMDAVGDENDTWYDKLGKLVGKVWDFGKFVAGHTKELAIAGTTAFALFKTAPLWMPLIAQAVKAIMRGDSLAKVEFESNGTKYKMHYDIKDKKWELLYKGISFSEPPPEETNQLMNTEFFKKFIKQCQKYIEPIVKNENREAVIQAIGTISDGNTKKILEKMFSDDSVLDNMFALKFKY